MIKSTFPSPLTQTVLKGKHNNRTVTMPSDELFRVKNIFYDHEYSIQRQFLPSTPITVVDIGANVGLFAVYMHLTQSVDTIHCFEPSPASLELLMHNTAGLKNTYIHPYGLINRDGRAEMMIHPRNTGQNRIASASMKGVETIEVQIRDAGRALDQLGLGYFDVLKIDTEGCEIPILESLKTRLNYIGIILLEYHSEADRRHIDQLLSKFSLIGAKSETMNMGTLKYINQKLLKKR